ncbi:MULTISPECIES: FAD-dependent oxidoreductase [Lysinibacillus]|uniref:FAD-dependent oxidoreductase n=1 Tax=Lysinibacillus TaxID=400634 RepID=UPI0021A2C662|nr:FAD-dependent oxidoreductase [Lysinibacillus capsici]MCT1540287.1 FAD-dependent oxidoreductase [Lysinibacillus capsici]MCT1571355.1 FAD-dependent oxidoreductase [Lysinibacillus capsici]MCT1647855.1 FAD-dependent oxidoreductase [Lysinibacillus capsici]MCT1726396.1 FAD-dependent oxidoreductase [Lysinibacillus capsici]MCT1783501.1 FAD-dependent oxidoreductase [Lysinibacillus capsici]
MKWDASYDVVVVGSGAAGLTAGLTAKLQGMKSLVIEKTDRYGGASAISGGALWIPNNHIIKGAGVPDTHELARQYLDSTIGDRVPEELKETYITRGPEMLRFLYNKTKHMRFQYAKGYSDYYPEKPGGLSQGRSIEPLIFDLTKMGSLANSMRRATLSTKGFTMNSYEFHKVNMITRTLKGKTTALKLGARLVKSKVTKSDPVALGEALIARLRLSLAEANGELWLSTAFKDFIMGKGRVIGIIVERDGQELKIEAKKGVVLSSGGFSHNQTLREKYLPSPTNAAWTSSPEGQTGDILEPGVKIGATLDLMDKVWGAPSVIDPQGHPFFLVADRGVPNMIVVDSAGQRFVNEAAPYHEFVDTMYKHQEVTQQAVPSWILIDASAKSRYIFTGLFPGQAFPKSWFEHGVAKSAETIEELAKQMEVPAENLVATVNRFNDFARNGHDDDFYRGGSAYDNYYGDPTLPNPNLAEIKKAPFYALRLYPGDIGTKGGLVVDEYARVIKENGEPIEGLYASGNCSASIMGETYPGPGATIGPGMTLSFVATAHMANAVTKDEISLVNV